MNEFTVEEFETYKEMMLLAHKANVADQVQASFQTYRKLKYGVVEAAQWALYDWDVDHVMSQTIQPVYNPNKFKSNA